ncbi:putative nebulette-like [Triplophysa rosa]|uniref:Nebulette-like n=1 Tax=Triplophysa rosa TaxID=992332 RepID=A0A9W7TAA2_TRIRA|nr:putative nebulette-like [Triplophysa rosa]
MPNRSTNIRVMYRKGKEELHKYSEVTDRPDILNAIRATKLASDVNYKQKFEKEKKPQYNPKECVSFKHAQTASELASQIEYRKEYECSIKGKVLLEADQTPVYLTARNASALMNEKEYRKDLEQEVKGKGLTGLEETPELQRVRNAGHILSEKEYRKDLEREIRGKRSDLTSDSLDIQRAKKASEINSDVQYRESVGSGTAVTHTPEMERVRRNQENISDVKYKKAVDPVSVGVTPELERIKQNQQNISSVQYQRGLQEVKGHSCSELDTPEMRRVRKSQESASMVKYHEEFERTRGRGAAYTLHEQHMTRLHGDHQMGGSEVHHGIQPQVLDTDRRSAATELKVWRTDPGSIFDFDPLEDDIQSMSLRRMTERACRQSRQQCAQSVCSSLGSEFWADRSGSVCSSSASVLHERSASGVYQHHPQHHVQGYGHMQPTRSVQSSPQSSNMRVYRALYDYSAQDHDEVSFRDGDVIINAQPIDEGWMFGIVQRTGRSGMLPANYVECFN